MDANVPLEINRHNYMYSELQREKEKKASVRCIKLLIEWKYENYVFCNIVSGYKCYYKWKQRRGSEKKRKCPMLMSL